MPADYKEVLAKWVCEMLGLSEKWLSYLKETTRAAASAKLKQAGYETHMVGKGHLGYQTTDHLPVNRGFVSDTTFQHSPLLASVSGLRVSLLLPGRAFSALPCV